MLQYFHTHFFAVCFNSVHARIKIIRLIKTAMSSPLQGVCVSPLPVFLLCCNIDLLAEPGQLCGWPR